jgi:hypothetical protein
VADFKERRFETADPNKTAISNYFKSPLLGGNADAKQIDGHRPPLQDDLIE